MGRWSGDIGVGGVVHDVASFNGVLAFGIGLVFAYALEPRMIARKRATVATEPVTRQRSIFHRAAADEPMAAEREEAAAVAARSADSRSTTVR